MGIAKQRNKVVFASPLRYPGGKTRLASFLANVIDKNFRKNEKIILVEPYAGGAGASLTLLFAGKVNKIIINDFDKAIYTFWKVAVSNTDYLIQKIRRTEITVNEWRKQKNIFKTPLNQHELAFATIFLNRTNRSGIINARPVGGMGQNSEWKINARFTKQTIIDRLQKIKKFRNKIEVSRFDGIQLLEKLEKKSQSENYFIFLDPPYHQKSKSLYLNYYNDEDHKSLAKFLETSSLKWFMTYDDVPYINDLYSKKRTEMVSVQHNAFKSRIGKELMIFSDVVTEAI